MRKILTLAAIMSMAAFAGQQASAGSMPKPDAPDSGLMNAGSSDGVGLPGLPGGKGGKSGRAAAAEYDMAAPDEELFDYCMDLLQQAQRDASGMPGHSGRPAVHSDMFDPADCMDLYNTAESAEPLEPGRRSYGYKRDGADGPSVLGGIGGRGGRSGSGEGGGSGGAGGAGVGGGLGGKGGAGGNAY